MSNSSQSLPNKTIPSVCLNNGITIPILGLGTYKIQDEQAERIVLKAIELGYRHFDTAYYYQNLQPIGRAIRQAIQNGTIKREDLFITTKVWPTWYGPGRVEASVSNMLRESGLEYFDLVLLHWPMALIESNTEMIPCHQSTNKAIFGKDDFVDTYYELENVQRKGSTRSIGVSNFNQKQLERLLKSATIVPVTNQVECHLYLAQNDLKNFCSEHRISLTAYCPLGNRPGSSSLLENEVIKSIAKELRKTSAQIAIKWLVQRNIIAIPKTSDPKRLEENLNVFDFELDPNQMERLNRLDQGEQGRMIWFNVHDMDEHSEYPFEKDQMINRSRKMKKTGNSSP
ncbi:aldehyde reductase-like protein 1 [Sarcoptes scabiei]|uniref:Aldehyde reductase-like protein 1 n=1 Tax=Sarcoptes scabiei TaxID=52283 RepID=A0A131ZY54_SARSC|nr:aldehyde reductase-like protein 1 [Sarcoptes scabiei]